MIKEIEQCVALGKLDVLQCFCNSCAHKFLGESVLVTQCLKCRVQQGITRISNGLRWKSSTPDREFLAGC
ncbi:MAG TPA: hypothetical protein VIX18_11825 [Nitrospirota bacterium]